MTYQITASNVEQYATAAPNGTESLANMIITDTLPPTATFVSGSRLDQMKDTVAPCTVSGQNASGQGGTVTCPPIDDPLGPTVNRTGQVAYITVTYPATQPAANTPANQADDGVTNSATVTAQPYGRPSVTVTASSAVTHGFRPVTGGGPGVSMAKGNNSQGIVYQGQSSVIWTNTMRNTGTAPLTVHWIDRMPCGYVSPTATTDPCPNLTDPVNSIQPNWGYRDVSRPAVVNVIYADGTTDTHSWSGVQTNATRAWSPAKPVAVMEWTVPLDPGESFGVSLLSTVKATLAVPNPDPANTAYVTNVSRTDGNTYLENCLSDTRYQLAGSSTWTNVTLAPVHGARCAVKQVLAASPLCNTNCSKTATNATQAPGGLVDFALRIQNTGNADMKPQFLDLLPPQLKVKPGSVVIPVGTATTPTRATANIEILDNYADTGRQLLRITWPDTQVLAVGTGTYTVTFQGIVQGGHAAGLYTNTVVYGDKDRVDICVVGNRVTDIYDLDGDGSTTDNQCKASGNFTIAGLAGIDLTKSVKGAADSDFKTTPTVGNAGTAMTGTYKLELKNSGSVDLKQTVFYDILPWVGDQAIGPATGPRDTAWTARSVSVNAPSGAVVQYSQSTNPCRGDLILGQAMTSGPAGCVNDWSNTAPTDLSLVKALRVSNSTPLLPGATRATLVEVAAPTGASGTAWNTASVTAQRFDNSWLQPTETAKVGLAIPADLHLSKAVTSPNPHVAGSKVIYRLTLTNDGPAAATGVVVTDRVPAGLTFELATPSRPGMTFAPATGAWTVGNLGVGESVTLDLRFAIAATATSVADNWAQVSAMNEKDADSTPNNGTAGTVVEDDEALAPLTLLTKSPAVQIVKKVSGHDANEPGSVVYIPGQLVTWTYEVKNTGNLPLINLTVTDDKGVVVTCPGGNPFPALAVGQSVTCTGEAEAVSGAYVNIGTVTATGTDGAGMVLTPVGSVTDDDPAHYVGIGPQLPATGPVGGDRMWWLGLVLVGVALLPRRYRKLL